MRCRGSSVLVGAVLLGAVLLLGARLQSAGPVPSGFEQRHQLRTRAALTSLDGRVSRLAEHLYTDLRHGASRSEASAQFAANAKQAADQFLIDAVGPQPSPPPDQPAGRQRRVHASMLCMLLDQLPAVLGRTKYAGETDDRPIRTLLVSYYNGKAYDRAAEQLFANRRGYCDRHGYSCALPGNLSVCGVSERFEAGLGLVEPGAWAKLPLLLQCLQSGRFRRVVWLDMDIVILRPELSVDQLLAGQPGRADLLFTEDCNCHDHLPHSPFNTGILVAQRTSEAFKLLTSALEMGCELEEVREHPWWDQHALHRLFKAQAGVGFAVVPQAAQWQCYDTLNMYCFDSEAAPFAVHVAGRGDFKVPRLMSIFKRMSADQ